MSAFGIEIREDCVCVFEPGTTKTSALDGLVAAAHRTGRISNIEEFRHAVVAREGSRSTGIGGGVAIPHVRIPAVTEAVVAVGVAASGIEFNAVDNKPVHVIVLFAMPVDANKLYLGLLAQVMVALKSPDFFGRLVACKTPAQVVTLLNESGA